MKAILVIRYSALGDVVLATSLVEPLRRAYPDATIEWVVDRSYAALLEGVVDGVISFSRSDRHSRAAALAQAKGRFDLAIDLQNKPWSTRVARAAAPKRLRLVRRTVLEALGSLLGRDTVLDTTHATTLYARAAALTESGPLRVSQSAEAVARATALLPDGRPWVGVAPGAAWATKRWPVERFGELAVTLQTAGYRVALLGGPMDAALLERFRVACPPDVDLSPEPLPVLAAALARCRAMVGNDSGLVHVAQAVGSRAVALFGPTSVRRWGPAAPSEAVSLRLACAPCTNHGSERCPLGHHGCLAKLPVDRVLETLRRVLADTAAGEPQTIRSSDSEF